MERAREQRGLRFRSTKEERTFPGKAVEREGGRGRDRVRIERERGGGAEGRQQQIRFEFRKGEQN